ncbi:hypothetical protein ACWDYH_39215 [Nocardia goodfellowii]
MIAVIIAAFDVCAVQEVQRNTTALRFLLTQLGPDWRAIVSDVTEGDNDTNGERLAYLYNTTRVQPSGLVGEIVLPPSRRRPDPAIRPHPLRRELHPQQHRVHPHHRPHPLGHQPPRPAPRNHRLRTLDARLEQPTQRLERQPTGPRGFQPRPTRRPLFDAFVSTGLWAPAELDTVDRTIFGNDNTTNYYDQIAWFSTLDNQSLLTNLTYTQRAGHFDFLPHCYPNLTRTQTSYRISDHYPLWAEFRIDP